MIVFLLVFVAVFVLFRLKARRRSTLAGLNSERPQYVTTPPLRSVLRREDDRP